MKSRFTGKCRRSFTCTFRLITVTNEVLGGSAVVAFHDIAVAILWILLAAKTLARTAMAMAFSFALEVSQHISLGEENMSPR